MNHAELNLIENGYQLEFDFSMNEEPVPAAAINNEEITEEKEAIKGRKRARELRIGDRVVRPQDEKLVISNIRDTGRYIYVTFTGGITVPYRADDKVNIAEK